MVLGTAVIVAGATYAVFHDTATVSGNTFSTGDSDLIKIKMPDNGCNNWSDSCTGVSWSGLYPGWNKSYNLYLKNVSDAPIIIQTIPVIVETGSSQDLWNNTYMEIVCTGNASTGRYSLSDWKNNVAVEIVPQLRQNEESGLCEVKFDVATSASNEIANASIGFNLVLNANQVGEGTVPATCESNIDCDDSNSATTDTCNAQHVCEHQTAPPANDADGDGFDDSIDTDDDNDGQVDPSDSDVLNPQICRDYDTDTCDDCSQNPTSSSTNNDIPWPAYTPSTSNDGPDSDADGICNLSDSYDCTLTNGGIEVCDGKDNDCNGEIDDLMPILNPNQVGECLGSIQTCRGSLGWEVDYDNDPDWQTIETKCDSRDNDCDGQIDEGLSFTNYYKDGDYDGYGNPNDFSSLCGPSGLYTVTPIGQADCNDDNGSIYPFAQEYCNGVDDDCDSQTDEDFPENFTECKDGFGYYPWQCISGQLACPY